MGNLFLSFAIAIGGAMGLVAASKAFDLDTYTSRIFPLIPLLYAIIYEILERRKTGKDRHIPPAQAKEEMKAGLRTLFKNVTLERILTAMGVSIVLKVLFEFLFLLLYLPAGQTLSSVYGDFNIETVGRFLRGDHPWLAGNSGLYFLALLAVITSFGTGLWIGFTAKGNAILEGVLTGTAVTLITAMTNMLILYRQIEDMAMRMADSMGYVMRAGFLVVLAVQVLLYGFWSGLAQKARIRHLELAAAKKSATRTKK